MLLYDLGVDKSYMGRNMKNMKIKGTSRLFVIFHLRIEYSLCILHQQILLFTRLFE